VTEIVKDIVNKNSRDAKYATEVIITKFAAIPLVYQEVTEEQDAKLTFLKADYVAKDSIIQQIENLAKKAVVAQPQVHEIEENTEAIRILDRFHKDQCIVCDSEDIDWETLLTAKNDNRTKVQPKRRKRRISRETV